MHWIAIFRTMVKESDLEGESEKLTTAAKCKSATLVILQKKKKQTAVMEHEVGLSKVVSSECGQDTMNSGSC